MCKFHKDVARDIATNPATGAYDPALYAIALVAMAKFRIEQYMPAMHGCDGFIPAEMVTDTARTAFATSGLARTDSAIKVYRDAHIGALREAIKLTARSLDLSPLALNLPPLPSDPTQNGAFLDEAVVELFEGYDRPGYVSGELRLKDAAHAPAFEAIRTATAHFMEQPGVAATLKTMFEGALARIFQDAQADLNAGRGHKKTGGCVMCHERRLNP